MALVGKYEEAPAACHAYDPRAAAAAQWLVEAIGREGGIRAEHVGSTAVPGCAGKGVIDLLVPYPAGGRDHVVALLDRLGFQAQTSGNIFPPERPMRRGTVVHEGARFRVNAHVVPQDGAEAAALLCFRDRLRADRELRDAYVAQKRALLEAGLTDPGLYSNAKGDFVSRAITGGTGNGGDDTR